MKKLVISLTFVCLQGLFLLATGQNNYNKPNWPLEVLSWDIDKAYPGIEYNYRLGVKGGEYPYDFTLVDGPSGMTVSKNSGEIVWKPASLLTDTVVIKISDISGNSLVHRFAITSTKNGFYFVDGAKGADNTNTGSESSPWKTMKYASATADIMSYVYVKKGTYNETFAIEPNSCGRFIAYPGDSVKVVSSQSVKTGAAIWINGGEKRLFQGFIFDANDCRWFFSVKGIRKNIIWRKNEMRNAFDTVGQNPAFVFFWDENVQYTNMVIQDNVFHDLRDPKVYHGASVTSYQMTNSLYEDNHAYDIDGRGFQEKVGGRRNTIRNNVFHDIYSHSAIYLNSNPSSDSTEICFNHIYNCKNGGITIGANGTYVANIFVHHNTCIGSVNFGGPIRNVASYNINVYKNIIGEGIGYPYGMDPWNEPNFLDGFRSKVSIDSNIVFGKTDLTQIAGWSWGVTPCNWKQWQDSGKDVHSIPMQLELDSNHMPILPDSLKIYGSYGSDYSQVTDVKMGENDKFNKETYILSQNYPNPFNPSTTIKYTIPESPLSGEPVPMHREVRGGFVTLKIFDVLGREVTTLVNEHKPAGSYTVEWNGTNSAGQQVGSGIYFYQLKTSNGFMETKKMLLIK